MTGRPLEEERLRAALAASIELLGDGGACPDPDRLVASGRGDLAPGGDEDVILHIAACTACAAAWRIAREVAGDRVVEARTPARRTSPYVGWAGLAAAAALILAAIGGSAVLLYPDRSGESAYREQEGDSLRSLLSESEPLPRERFVLRWTGGPEGTLYDVLVTDERMSTLERGIGLERAELRVPAAALQSVEPGGRVFWQVSAHLTDGRRIESPTFIATVR